MKKLVVLLASLLLSSSAFAQKTYPPRWQFGAFHAVYVADEQNYSGFPTCSDAAAVFSTNDSTSEMSIAKTAIRFIQRDSEPEEIQTWGNVMPTASS